MGFTDQSGLGVPSESLLGFGTGLKRSVGRRKFAGEICVNKDTEQNRMEGHKDGLLQCWG